jgi:hypothetical protein
VSETFTCPKGHVLMPDQLVSTVDLTVEDIDKAIIFTCQTGDWSKDKGKNWHDFTLARAIKVKMFTTDQVARIRAQAEEYRMKMNRSI